jgi:hypothetical protein
MNPTCEKASLKYLLTFDITHDIKLMLILLCPVEKRKHYTILKNLKISV